MDPTTKWGSAFKVSAPGKVILHGEYSVVHGATALAASLGLRTKLRVSPSCSADVLSVDFPNIELQRNYSITNIRGLIAKQLNVQDLSEKEEIPLEVSLSLVNGLKTDAESLNPKQETALACLFHVILVVSREIIGDNDSLKDQWPIIPAANFHIDTRLPVGAGAGSSAAFCVCLAAANMHITHALLHGNVNWGFESLTKEILQQVARLANCGEKLMHGRPSGVDSAVSTYGGVLQFKSGQIDPIGQIPLQVLLVDCGVGRQTKAMLAGMHARMERNHAVVLSILEAMDKLALKALEHLKFLIEKPSDEETFKALEELADINQGLLWSLGVSHPSLDRILSLGSSIAGLHGKLTGAGGGGLAYLLLPPSSEENSDIQKFDLQKLKTSLAESGFKSDEVRLGGPGLELSLLTDDDKN